jgi:hypothetical protein
MARVNHYYFPKRARHLTLAVLMLGLLSPFLTGGGCGGGSSSSSGGSSGSGTPPPTFIADLVVSAITQPSDVARNSTSIFWAPKHGGEGLYKVNKAANMASTSTADTLHALDAADVTVLAHRMDVPLNVIVHNGDYIWVGLSNHVMSLYRTSPDGLTTQKLSEGNEISYAFYSRTLVVDDTAVYWVAGSTNVPIAAKIEKVPLDGSPPIELTVTAAGGYFTVSAFTADDTYLYWLEDSDILNVNTVRRVSKDGGTVETLAQRNNPNNNRGLAVAGGMVYFSDYPDIFSVPAQGGTVELLTGDWPTVIEATEMVVHDQTLYWMTFTGLYATQLSDGTTAPIALLNTSEGLRSLLAQPEGLFWTEQATNNNFRVIKRMDWDTETITVLAGGAFYSSLFRDGDSLYAADQSYSYEYGQLVMVPIDGGVSELVLTGIQHDNNKIAADDDYVYILDKYALKRVPVDGGTVLTLNLDLTCPMDNPYNQIFVDNGWVYFNCLDYGIYKISRDGGAPVSLINDDKVSYIKQYVGVYGGYLYFIVDKISMPSGYDRYLRLPVGGGAVESVYEASPTGEILAAEGTSILYTKEWIYNDLYKLLRVDSGTGDEILLHTGAFLYKGMGKDYLYFYDYPFTELTRVPKLGGSSELLMCDEYPVCFDKMFNFGDAIYYTVSYTGGAGTLSDLYELISG